MKECRGNFFQKVSFAKKGADKSLWSSPAEAGGFFVYSGPDDVFAPPVIFRGFDETAVAFDAVCLEYFADGLEAAADTVDREDVVFFSGDCDKASRGDKAGEILHIEISVGGRNVIADTMENIKNRFGIGAECTARSADLDALFKTSGIEGGCAAARVSGYDDLVGVSFLEVLKKPASSILILRSICLTITSICLSLISTPCILYTF